MGGIMQRHKFCWGLTLTVLVMSDWIQCEEVDIVRPSRSIGTIAKMLLGNSMLSQYPPMTHYATHSFPLGSFTTHTVQQQPDILIPQKSFSQPTIVHYQQPQPQFYQPYIFLAQPTPTPQNVTPNPPDTIPQTLTPDTMTPPKLTPSLPFDNNYYPPPWTQYQNLQNYFSIQPPSQIDPTLNINTLKTLSPSLKTLTKVRAFKRLKIKGRMKVLNSTTTTTTTMAPPTPVESTVIFQNSLDKPITTEGGIGDFIVVSDLNPVELVYPPTNPIIISHDGMIGKLTSYFKSLMSNMRLRTRKVPDSYLNSPVYVQDLRGGRRSFQVVQ